jgi:hypothetical protein
MSVSRGINRGDGACAEMHVCPNCDSKLVEPTDWSQLAEWTWEVHLRCPECEWRGAGEYTQSDVDRFDETLDDGVDSIFEDLRQLTRSNMEDEGARFVSALEADRILPEDF